MLCWQAHEALMSGSMADCETALRGLVSEMKDTQITKVYPQLEKLADLLPLLPTMHNAMKHVRPRNHETSWLAQGESIVAALSDSASPTLREFKHTYSDILTRWIAQTLKSGLSSAGRAMAARVPGADAAPVSASVAPASGTHRIGRRLLGLNRKATGLNESEDEDEADWDGNARINVSASDLEEMESDSMLQKWGTAGAGASAGVGLLAAIFWGWRTYQKNLTAQHQHQAEAGASAGDPGFEEIPLNDIVAESPLPTGTGEALLPVTAASSGARSSSWLDKALPLAALTFGLGIPATLLLTLQARPDQGIDELEAGDIARILEETEALFPSDSRSGRTRRRAGGDRASENEDILPLKKFLDTIAKLLPASSKKAAMNWLRKTIKAIIGERDPQSLSFVILTISISQAILTWFNEHETKGSEQIKWP